MERYAIYDPPLRVKPLPACQSYNESYNDLGLLPSPASGRGAGGEGGCIDEVSAPENHPFPPTSP
ncbi:hypothetical protein CS8_017000 [Cupriavidus sp. 8B]